MQTKPDYQDAMLTLKLYELRREPIMRQSRDMIQSKFWPKSIDDLMSLTKPDNPMNAAYRQVSSYWEMVYGMARHGIANADYMVETNGEGLFLLAKVHPFLEQFRREYSPLAFLNAEWIATNCEAGQTRFALIQKRVRELAEKMR